MKTDKPKIEIGQRVLFHGWYKRNATGNVLRLGGVRSNVSVLVQWDDRPIPEWVQAEFLIPEGPKT